MSEGRKEGLILKEVTSYDLSPTDGTISPFSSPLGRDPRVRVGVDTKLSVFCSGSGGGPAAVCSKEVEVSGSAHP